MASFAIGTITNILDESRDLVRLRVLIDDAEIDAVAFPGMLGDLDAGHRVVVNTTGIALGLGTGATGFVLWDLDSVPPPDAGNGHIVKLRYTPWQTNVLASESPESPHHADLANVVSIDGMPVVACSLHSQIAAAAAGIKDASPEARVGYLMTDGAALPLAWSRLVAESRAAGLIDVTSTAGHAFGGELEAVNVFSGLASLRHAGKVDAAIVAMGPGVVGTGTVLGHTALEQGQILDAVTALGGTAIASLRVSFADQRERQWGISHHTLTALTVSARERSIVVLPELDRHGARLRAQLENAGIAERHEIVTADGHRGIALMVERGVKPTSMGRTLDETPELFEAAAAAGAVAGSHVSAGGQPGRSV